MGDGDPINPPLGDTRRTTGRIRRYAVLRCRSVSRAAVVDTNGETPTPEAQARLVLRARDDAKGAPTAYIQRAIVQERDSHPACWLLPGA